MADRYQIFSLTPDGREVEPPFPDLDTTLPRDAVQELFTLAMLENSRPCRYDGPSDVYRMGALVFRPHRAPSVFFPPKPPEIRPLDALAPQEF